MIPEEEGAEIQHESDDGDPEGPRPEDHEGDPGSADAPDEPKCSCRLVDSTTAAGAGGDVTAEASRLLHDWRR